MLIHKIAFFKFIMNYVGCYIYDSIENGVKVIGSFYKTADPNNYLVYPFINNGILIIDIDDLETEILPPTLYSVPSLVLDKRNQLIVTKDFPKTPVYVVHKNHFENGGIVFRIGMAGIFAVEFCFLNDDSLIKLDELDFPKKLEGILLLYPEFYKNLILPYYIIKREVIMIKCLKLTLSETCWLTRF